MSGSAFLFEPPKRARLGPMAVWAVEAEVHDVAYGPWIRTEFVDERLSPVVLASDVPDRKGIIGKVRTLRWDGYFINGRIVSATSTTREDRPEEFVQIEMVPAEMGYQ